MVVQNLFYSITVYLIKNKKPYIVAFLPAIVCTLIAFGYILQASEGLRLPSMTANIISVIATIIISAVFLKKFK